MCEHLGASGDSSAVYVTGTYSSEYTVWSRYTVVGAKVPLKQLRFVALGEYRRRETAAKCGPYEIGGEPFGGPRIDADVFVKIYETRTGHLMGHELFSASGEPCPEKIDVFDYRSKTVEARPRTETVTAWIESFIAGAAP